MKLFDLTGKVAIITGGSSGIGLAIAEALAEAGAKLVIAARDEARLKLAAQELMSKGADVLAVSCDVADGDSITAMVKTALEHYEHLDILVNNAGMNIRKRPEELSYEEWRQVLNTNLDSVFRCSTACYPALKQAGGGKILNNGSMLSLFGVSWGAAYSAAKGGMVQLTQSLAAAWARDNIQVNCFLPGWVDTPLTVNARAQIKGLNEKVLERTPIGRWANVDDFKGIAIFLASSASDYITGTSIAVDGGFSINLL